jgi:DNA modification methylase
MKEHSPYPLTYETPDTSIRNPVVKAVRESLSLFEDSTKVVDAFDTQENVAVICAKTLEVCRSLPSELFGLIITSPPYNIGKEYEEKLSLESYLETQKEVIQQLARLLKPTGSLCWQVGNYVDNGEVFPLDIFFYPIFKQLGLKLRNRIVWHFDHGLHASKRFSGRYETLLWFTKSDDYVFNLDSVRVPAKYPGKRHFKGEKKGQLSGNPKGKNPSDYWIWEIMSEEWESGIWEIPNVKANHCEKTIHPCQFPVELVERCVLSMTQPDEWVLDPYTGVGSSLIAAIRHQRRAVGIDRDERYVKIAKERIYKYLNGNLRLRPLGKPVHSPSGREKITQVPLEWL